ncbi:beta-mammal toxin Cn2-like [Centruroides sculpturatus]|uniref:beta-mammal toxin Cn2-like n=1 Tax=Centruroides sculpturatus TaxID=218467 RepID=UPI000C6CB895|nr:beta-mammal toxin Cn2-like [Centruroides sculpturatus]
MNSLLIITACLALVGTVWAKEGYLVNKSNGCKYECLKLGDNDYCLRECRQQYGKASGGYCYAFGCWCTHLYEQAVVWPLPNKKCSGK